MRRLLLLVLLIPTALIVVVLVRFTLDARDPYPEVDVDPADVPTFREIPFPFVHEHDSAESLPFTGSAVIDADGDGTEEVFIGGGYHQQDGLFAFRGDRFEDISEGSGLTKSDGATTFGAAVIDATGDGRSDLLVARDDGITLYSNEGGGRFSGRRLDIAMNEKTTPLSLGLIDLEADGDVDFYISGYVKWHQVEGQNIFNRPEYGGTSVMARNEGGNRFSDVTRQTGLEYLHNTFQGVFVDADEDGDPDLVVAHDTGQVRTWRNRGDGRFDNAPNPNSQQYSYPMGIAVGDYDNDGRVDFFFSNVGTTTPNFIVKGDLRDDQDFNPRWMLFQNQGDFGFQDTAEATSLADFEFSWGAVFEDFNLDGLQDLVVAENYIGFPPHRLVRLPGRLLIQRPDHRFAAAEDVAGIVNEHYAIAPLVADFNDDGYPDLVWVNLDGPVRAFLNEGGDAHYLKVELPDSPESLGAIVRVTTGDGKTFTRHLVSNEGLLSEQSHVLLFGLGQATSVARVEVTLLSGRKRIIDAPAIDSTLEVRWE